MRTKKKIAVFASGNGTNAENIFQYFQNHAYITVSLLLCNVTHAPVLQKAKKYSIPSLVFDKADLYEQQKILKKLQKSQIDWLILAGFLWLMPLHLIDRYCQKIINIHPALLPKYGGKGMYGMRVHQAVALAKEKETGITIHYVSEAYDEGKIIFQKKCVLDKHDTLQSIAEKVHQLEYKYYPKIIESVLLDK